MLLAVASIAVEISQASPTAFTLQRIVLYALVIAAESQDCFAK
jgi:hypothetical protein